jgi:membrane-associated phospholipid phosphatase
MRSLIIWFRNSAAVRIVAGFVVAALLLAALGWLVTGPYKGVVAGFDSNIRYAMRHIQSPMWTSLLLTATKLGSTIYLVIIGCVAGIVFLVLRWFRPFFLFIIVMAGQAALHHGFKLLIARPRPSALMGYREVESFSFPSGHAVAGLCMYGAIAWIVATHLETPAAKVGIAISAAVLIFLIGMSRVYIGIHYPTDVVAGFVGGLVWLAAVMSADRRPL